MKHLIFSTIALTTTAQAAPRELREHVDLHWAYEAGNGWSCLAKTVVEGEDAFDELDDVYLQIDDSPGEMGGQRYLQPDGYPFTGVAVGEAIWVATQFQQTGQTWPGFNSYQSTGVFGSYQETDTRLSEDDRVIPLPWVQLTLSNLTYQGSGNGTFSLWQVDQFGSPTLWMATAEQTHPDTFFFEAGSHKHLNWGFGALGLYRIRFTASAYLGPGKTNPTGQSTPFAVTFAVGQFAQWQAGNFTATQLDNAGISGPNADPDLDGLKNLIEYAFGTHPLNGSATPVTAGLGLPKFSLVEENGVIYQTLKYPRRKAGERHQPEIYQPLFSDSLSGVWSDAGAETTTADFPQDPDWELVTSRRAQPSGAKRGFARVAVIPGGM